PLLGERSQLLGLQLGLQRLRQLGEVPVHDVVDLVQRESDAMIGDPSLREVVGAYALGAVTRPYERLARSGFLRLLLTHLLVLDARRQDGERLFLVLVLRACVLALHHYSGRKMRDSHRRVPLVHGLPPGGARLVPGRRRVPEERKVSMRFSAGLRTVSPMAAAAGSAATVQAEVWMRPWVSVAGTRCPR